MRIVADVVIKYPKFSSSGFIAFPRPPETRREFEVDLEFRPDLLTGLLVFAADDLHLRQLFFSVAVVKGRVEFRYVCTKLILRFCSKPFDTVGTASGRSSDL